MKFYMVGFFRGCELCSGDAVGISQTMCMPTSS